jgi:hypothetical protein
MEIITYVLEGALEHKDSMGNGSIIRPGDVQRMTAGTGVTHSEFNPSAGEPVHLLQIWIVPERRNLTPGYEQKTFPGARLEGGLTLIASRDGREDSVTVHQNVALYAGRLPPGRAVSHGLAEGRFAWIQVTRGSVTANGETLQAGDGVAIAGETQLTLAARDAAEVLLFDLA